MEVIPRILSTAESLPKPTTAIRSPFERNRVKAPSYKNLQKTATVLPSKTGNEFGPKIVSFSKATSTPVRPKTFKELENKRRERQLEALKKREAFIQANIEEKKRRQDQKQIKAQQQREALKKEKCKFLETQRLQREQRKLLVGHEVKNLKQKKLETKKKGGEKTVGLLQQYKQQQHAVIDTTKKRLYFPRGTVVAIPEWSINVLKIKYQLVVGESIINSFFSVQAQTPDLLDIFEDIESPKLKRSSSAKWDKPSRFTKVLSPENHNEV